MLLWTVKCHNWCLTKRHCASQTHQQVLMSESAHLMFQLQSGLQILFSTPPSSSLIGFVAVSYFALQQREGFTVQILKRFTTIFHLLLWHQHVHIQEWTLFLLFITADKKKTFSVTFLQEVMGHKSSESSFSVRWGLVSDVHDSGTHSSGSGPFLHL